MHQDITRTYQKEIEELAVTSRRLAELGFVASHGGNLSFRVADDIILITPTKVEKRLMRAEDIVAVNSTGEVLYAAPNRKPTGETPMHLLILNQRPDLNAVVHAHPPVLTGFSMVNNALLEKPLLPEPVLEVGPIFCVPYAEPISEALANEFKPFIPRTNAWLMQNHGITLGCTEGINRAVGLLEMTEAMALSVAIGSGLGEVGAISRHEVSNMERTITTRSMPRPGDPRFITSLSDLFFADTEN